MNRSLSVLFVSLLYVKAYATAPFGEPSAAAPCSHPATVEGSFNDKSPNLIVKLRPGANSAELAQAWAHKYGLNIRSIFLPAGGLNGFIIGDVDTHIIGKLRCEPGVDVLSFDAPISTGSTVTPAHLTNAWSGP